MRVPKRYIICSFAFIAQAFISIFHTNNSSVKDYITIFGDQDIYNGSIVYHHFGHNYTISELRKIKNTAKMGSLVGASCAILSGALATSYGGSRVFGIGLFINAVNNFFTPLTLAANLELFIFNRFINGASHMVSQCAMSDVWSRWSLPSERSSIVAFAQVGLFASVFFHHTVSNWIAFSLNWPCVFYITGVGGMIWALLWLLYVKDDPDHDDKLSDEERDQLAERLNFVALKRTKLSESPWKMILSSAPVWALGASALLLNSHVIFTYIQVYLNDKQHINDEILLEIKKWMAYSSLLSMLVAGYLADFLRNKYKLTDTKIRKGYICSAYLLTSLLLSLFWFSSTFIKFVVYFSIYELCRSISDVAILVNVIDISPAYSSTLNGLYQTLATIGSILHQSFIEDTIKNDELAGFEFCFFFYFLLYVASAVLYHLWGSAEPQPWKTLKKHDDEAVELA